jgi:hypothetical protein
VKSPDFMQWFERVGILANSATGGGRVESWTCMTD